MKYRIEGKDYDALNIPDYLKIKIFPKKKTKHQKSKQHRENSLKWYYENKERCLENNKKWKKEHPGYRKEKNNEYFKKWFSLPENKKKMAKIMRDYYIKNKDKQRCRSITYKCIAIPKKCKCGATKNLQIHHEIYPVGKVEILKAISNGKIYYLCKSCHKSQH